MRKKVKLFQLLQRRIREGKQLTERGEEFDEGLSKIGLRRTVVRSDTKWTALLLIDVVDRCFSCCLPNFIICYDAGKSEYFASSSILFVIEFILFHYVEIRRWQDIKNTRSVNQDPIFKSYSLPPNEVWYPSGIFNPLNFTPTAEAKEKEIANGQPDDNRLHLHRSPSLDFPTKSVLGKFSVIGEAKALRGVLCILHV
ncbi:hypothetical protein LXL04_012800 [Taraxacum kok-saghyz]